MTFKQQLANDAVSVFFNSDEFADVGTFKSFATGTETANVPFIFNVGSGNTQQNYGVADIATVMIPAASIADPQRHDTITTTTKVYTLMDKISGDDNINLFAVEAEERHNPR